MSKEFEEIYTTYAKRIYGFLCRLTRDNDLSEDLLQETFYRAIKNSSSFRADSKIETWLCQIAKNTYFDYQKKQARVEELPEEYGEPVSSPEEAVIRESDKKAIHKVLHSLKEPYKEVFTLRTYGDLSFSEIAELFEKTTSWARVTYHRARAMIKEALKDE